MVKSTHVMIGTKMYTVFDKEGQPKEVFLQIEDKWDHDPNLSLLVRKKHTRKIKQGSPKYYEVCRLARDIKI